MAQVLIRDIEDDVIERLKLKAQIHSRSLEGELREILRQAAPLTVEQKQALAARGGTFVTADARLPATLAQGGWGGTAMAL